MTSQNQAGTQTSGLSPAPSGILARSNATRSIEAPTSSGTGVVAFDGRDRRARPFNMLRTQVVNMARGSEKRIIGVTSATPQVGKSFIAANLAASLSKLPDIRTFLFDFDLRRGSVAERFDIPVGKGVNSFLSGEIDTLGEIAYDVSGTGLTIYPSFPTGESSAELLAGSRLRSLVASMRGLPDNVICLCDLPPAFANDDAAIVLREIDGYLFVVEEGTTTVHQVRDAISVLKPATCLGTVFNRYHGGIGGDDYGFGYGRQRQFEAYYS